MGPATDKHQAPTHRLKLYVRAVIESEARTLIDSVATLTDSIRKLIDSVATLLDNLASLTDSLGT